MRAQIKMQQGWWVSASAHDARLAATARNWKTADLELANDRENHPRRIALPGGWAYGLRPLHDAPAAADRVVLPAESEFVGPSAAAPARRLPSHFLTYARQVQIPESWAGQTIFLHLNNARYHVTILVNGEKAGHYVGGLEPRRFDVSGLVRPGAANEIAITVGDVGVSGHRPFDPHNFTGTRLPTCKEIENNLIHPVNYGGSDGRGIEEVALEAVPPVRVEYLFANPSVRHGLLRLTVALANDTALPVTARLRGTARAPAGQTLPDTLLRADGTRGAFSRRAKRLLDETVTIPARGQTKITRDIPWRDAILWDTDQPHLYELRTTLAAPDGKRHDTCSDTFGFREFTINGHDFILNGRKIHLRGQSGHVGPQQHAMSLAEKIEFLRVAKEEGNINHVRLHARPQDRRWVAAADRVGMLVTTETALWTTGFHSFDWAGSEEACYENVRTHYLNALVRRDRNAPSVVIWSLSNEMSPITLWDLTDGAYAPKMAAMTRVFKRILAEVAAEDSSRVTQMSSAMDFLGNLAMYNLHYPKNWQAYPDYPHTAYWLDGAFKFRWYGQAYDRMPAWSWQKDKPLYFGEYTCVHGTTPDNQASIVGDAAFEEADFGTALVQEKLWWMEAQAYRRQDVSGFCAWAYLLGNETDCRKLLALPEVAAVTRAMRPVAVLNHCYRRTCLGGAELAFPLSIHNDTRHDLDLELHCEARCNGAVVHRAQMPLRRFTPGASIAFTSRLLAPAVEASAELTFRATLSDGNTTCDTWEHTITVWPQQAGSKLPDSFGIFDPDCTIASQLQTRGISGGRFLRELHESAIGGLTTLWLPFGDHAANNGDWQHARAALRAFVKAGGALILDRAPAPVLADLPVPLANGKGFVAPDDRLEITYAYPRAPFHPALAGFSDDTFALWGDDHYVARRCAEIPQEGNAVPLLVAGTDRSGLSSSPLLELRYGAGSFLVSTLEVLPKIDEEPAAANVLSALAAYRPAWGARTAAISLEPDAWKRLQEVGYIGANEDAAKALAADIAVLDGARAINLGSAALRAALDAGHTVCLHALDPAQTAALLRNLALPGEVLPGAAKPGEWDVFRHTHPLANGMTHNYLYWIVGKSRVAPWTRAPTHPEPASALIRLLQESADAASLTRRGAVTVYRVGAGTLVIDNLRWHLSDFDEPERPRRYIRCLLTNLGVPLLKGVAKQMGEEFETEAERRERGHF